MVYDISIYIYEQVLQQRDRIYLFRTAFAKSIMLKSVCRSPLFDEDVCIYIM